MSEETKPTYPRLRKYLRNPYQRYPRNEECWCKSGVKAKKCCLPNVPDMLPREAAEYASKHIKTLRDLCK